MSAGTVLAAPPGPVGRLSRYRTLRRKSISTPVLATTHKSEPVRGRAAVPAPISIIAAPQHRSRSLAPPASSVSRSSSTTRSEIAARDQRANPDVPPVPALPLGAHQRNNQFLFYSQQQHLGFGRDFDEGYRSSNYSSSEYSDQLQRPREVVDNYSNGDASAGLVTSPRRFDVRKQAASQLGVQQFPSPRSAARYQHDCEHEWRVQVEREAAERRLSELREAARWIEENRLLEEQKRQELINLQAQVRAGRRVSQAAASKSSSETPRSIDSSTKSPARERFVLFKRGKRAEPGDEASPTSSTMAHTKTATTTSPPRAQRETSLDETTTSPPRGFIASGGRGIVPQMDAPNSASNAGERRVTIRCMTSSINLPVTPETTPKDLLYSAANLVTHHIDPKRTVVVECFVQFGLERRLRRYEPVRDVMNSWDRDAQNTLKLVASDDDESAANDRDLELSAVRRTQEPPRGFTVQMYHSQRSSKWQKRYITLLDSGQLIASKKPDVSLSDRDTHSLCHMSDFDVYTPTEAQMRKVLKPPKRFCFAVKSQQKVAVFINNPDNFVHYFCAEDEYTADTFYAMVHGWRSWYLVNRKIDMAATLTAESTSKGSKQHDTQQTNIVRSGTHRLKVSVDENPYTIGTFEPLLDMTRFEKPLEDFGRDFLPPTQLNTRAEGPGDQQQKQHRVKESPRAPQPTVKSPRRAARPLHAFPPTSNATQESEFAVGGLLGSAYESRTKQVQDRRRSMGASNGDDPFTNGPSLLNLNLESKTSSHARYEAPEQPRSFPLVQEPPSHDYLPRQEPAREQILPEPYVAPLFSSHRNPNHSATAQAQSTRSAGLPLSSSSRPKTSDGHGNGSTAQQRSARQAPKPLLDLSAPQSSEPQSWRAGHGHGVRVPTGVPLINMATGPTMGPAGAAVVSPAAVAAGAPPPIPPRDVARRDTVRSTGRTAAPSTRNVPGASTYAETRSRSQSVGARRALSPARHEYPPVPALPGTTIRDRREVRPLNPAEQRELQLQRGRVGTMKTC